MQTASPVMPSFISPPGGCTLESRTGSWPARFPASSPKGRSTCVTRVLLQHNPRELIGTPTFCCYVHS